MSNKIIRYKKRLGDILRCLPACKYLADQGHCVLFDCLEDYHSLFDIVSYVKPVNKITNDSDIIDLQVWPDKYDDYRQSKKSWGDFVYDNPHIKNADKNNIVLDLLKKEKLENLPERYHLIAPFGISQGYKRDYIELIKNAVNRLGQNNIIVLCEPDCTVTGIKSYTAKNVEQMARAIRDADEFWCINSAPVVLASALRRNKTTRFWGQRNEWETDNIFDFPGLIRVD